MTKAYRDNTDSLQAENERLRAEIAALKTKPPTVWGIRTDMDEAPIGAAVILDSGANDALGMVRRPPKYPVTYVALDRTSRPCPWPVP
jgi:cell division protein FtsB